MVKKINSINELNEEIKALMIFRDFKSSKSFSYDLKGTKLIKITKYSKNNTICFHITGPNGGTLHGYDKSYSSISFRNGVIKIFNDINVLNTHEGVKQKKQKTLPNLHKRQGSKGNNLFLFFTSFFLKIMDKLSGVSGIKFGGDSNYTYEQLVQKYKLLNSPLFRSQLSSFLDDYSDNQKIMKLSDLFTFCDEEQIIFDENMKENIQKIGEILGNQITELLLILKENINFFTSNRVYILDYAYSEESCCEIGNNISIINKKIDLFEEILQHLKDSGVYRGVVSKSKLIDLRQYFQKIEYGLNHFEILRMHDFFEIYAVLKKLISYKLSYHDKIYFSIKDNFRLCYIEENGKYKKVLARKIGNIGLDFNEIDFINYDFNDFLDIYDAKFYSSNITKTLYYKFYNQLYKYQRNFNTIILADFHILSSNKQKILECKSLYLRNFVLNISKEDIQNEIIYRNKISTFIKGFDKFNLKIGLGDIKYLFEKQKLKILSTKKELVIEDVFDNFNIIK